MLFKIETVNRPRSKLVREADPDNKLIRVFQHSPEDIALQVWNGKRYTIVALLPDEARKIGEQLIRAANELSAP